MKYVTIEHIKVYCSRSDKNILCQSNLNKVKNKKVSCMINKKNILYLPKKEFITRLIKRQINVDTTLKQRRNNVDTTLKQRRQR